MPPNLPQWELIHGPDLLEALNEKGSPMGEAEAAYYFAQLLRAVLFIHHANFAHR